MGPTSTIAPTVKARVLCVDDERNVLEGLAASLRRRYDVEVAASGRAALELLEERPSFDVVVSDFAMPEMDGAQFLALAHLAAPSTERLLLTGQASLDGAIAAVNAGHIFRFLTKPCSPDDLTRAIDDALEHARQAAADRHLAEWRAETLCGHLLAAERHASAAAAASEVGAELVATAERLGALAADLEHRPETGAPVAVEAVAALKAAHEALLPLARRLRGPLATRDAPGPAELQTVVRRVQQELSTRSSAPQADVHIAVPSEPIWLALSPTRAAQLLLNLIRNGLEATATTRPAKVEVVVTKRGRVAVLAVSDNGVGVPAAHVPLLFEPYYTTKPGHSGLGLFAVREIARAAGGSVELASEVGRGTTFEVHLPIQAPPSARAS